jgi:hypothetical protein
LLFEVSLLMTAHSGCGSWMGSHNTSVSDFLWSLCKVVVEFNAVGASWLWWGCLLMA